MSIYATIDGKSYKLPDALTIGRGEPFDVIDHTMGRAHARLVFRSGKWRIKDLLSDCGIMVNGVKIQPGKFTSVKPGDKILLGNVPLEVFEHLEAATEVKTFTAHEITDYAPHIYLGLGALGAVITFLESSGDSTDDWIFLAIIAAFLKLSSVIVRALRTVYFPVDVVLETNLTYEGATFHMSGNKNFSLKFEHVDKWYIVGKCFFIKAHKRDLVYLLHQGHEEFATLLRERCPKKRALGLPVLEKLALLPFIFVVLSWVTLYSSDMKFFHFLGQAFGVLGFGGCIALFCSEHLRELLPVPSTVNPKKITAVLATIIAVTVVMQFGQFRTHYKLTKLKNNFHSCIDLKTCDKYDFSILTGKSLSIEDEKLITRICQSGNKTACPGAFERKPASLKR